jgi:hypothetical protein
MTTVLLLLMLSAEPAEPAVPAEPVPDCGAAELIQAQADLTAGANLLASPDPVRSLLGLRLMQVAAERRDRALALCTPTKLPQLPPNALPYDDADQWQPPPKAQEPRPELPPGIDPNEAAVVLGVERNARVISEALLRAGLVHADDGAVPLEQQPKPKPGSPTEGRLGSPPN